MCEIGRVMSKQGFHALIPASSSRHSAPHINSGAPREDYGTCEALSNDMRTQLYQFVGRAAGPISAKDDGRGVRSEV